MNPNVNFIAGRLSLRQPQRRSLEILARVLDIAPPAKSADKAALDAALAIIAAEFPTFRSFDEREFCSMCFALATGVGKTRLMGAFVAYLYLTGRSRHFFVLAPNLTIYNKLIADFTPGTPKYVFQGISEFVTAPPVVITGDNYETGIGVRTDALRQTAIFRPGGENAVHINVFNISKINSEVRASTRGNQPPRIKRLAEYIGESYFDYLAKLPDLVLLMDESHRYRADSGTKAINELKPILGLELTATPFVEANPKPIPFKNVVYGYALADAIKDGFVKEPAVATRKDFASKGHKPEQIERIKLEDGVRLHEQVKTDLVLYAGQTGSRVVKPFMLVIAQDTAHADALVAQFKDPNFFKGAYADKVIQVHSALTGEEKEDTVKALLAVESAEEKTEIVVHVNMLKEGWDVTNLYTIVPLRAANARTLIEQSIGRGLRLPFGKRTGVKAVDRLTIVAHDKFQEIVDEANRGDSILKKIEVIELGEDGPGEPAKVVQAPTALDTFLGIVEVAAVPSVPSASPAPAGVQVGLPTPSPAPKPPIFSKPGAKEVVKSTLQKITALQHLKSAAEIMDPKVQAKMVAEVQAELPPEAALLYPEVAASVALLVKETTAAYVALSIDIPAITMVPKGEINVGFHEFALDTSVGFNLNPIDENILIHHLQSNYQEEIDVLGMAGDETTLENHVVSALLGFDDVDYEAHSELLYALAAQAVAYLTARLGDEKAARNVLMYYRTKLGQLIHDQMVQNRWQTDVGYDVKVTKGFRALVPATFALGAGESERNFRVPIVDKHQITKMVFGGFAKCLYPVQKFDSDPERRFSVVLENDQAVLKWVKPAKGNFHIDFKNGAQYEPDFVVETAQHRFLVEVKRSDYLDDDEVMEKAKAARLWCIHATAHTATTDGKPWRYLLIADVAIRDNMSLAGLANEYEWKG